MKKILSIALCSMLLQAGSAVADDFVGTWEVVRVSSFSPAQRYSDPKYFEMKGTIEIEPAKEGGYTGDLYFGQLHETCKIKAVGGKLNIHCKLEAPFPDGSAPENFTLQVVSSRLMSGTLTSNSTYLVDFVKQ